MFELKEIQLSVPHVLGTIAIIYVLCRIFWKLYIDARIRKLGARAPVRKTYVPTQRRYLQKRIGSSVQLVSVNDVSKTSGVSNVYPGVTGHPAWRDDIDNSQHNKGNNGLEAYELSG
jgi:hypothetical protein